MWRRSISFLLLLLSGPVSVPAQQNSTAPPAPNSPVTSTAKIEISVQNDVQYGAVGSEKLLLDLYQPMDSGSKPRPAVVMIHGGGWSEGDKQGLSAMASFLARWGFVVINVNYRLFNGKQNRWPAQLDDVQMAVRWLRANAAKYNVDPNRIGAFGHSAGAQLAALLGMEETRDNSDPALAKYSSRVQAVVDVAGPADFLTAHDPEGDAELTKFLGSDFHKNPAPWHDASPVDHVDKSNAPFLIIHGTQDDAVPMSQAQELYDKLHTAGVPVTLIKINDGHIFTTPEARRQLALETLKFFNQYLVAIP
jgi:acetyl esterase/lipase